MLAAISTSITALAGWTEHGNGAASEGSVGAWPFVYNEYTNLSWVVNLYVSTRSDGSIDPSKSSVTTGNGLARVGSIFYTKENFSNAKTFIQTELTDNQRGNGLYTYTYAKNGLKIYNMPQARLLDSDNIKRISTVTYFNNISLGDTIRLPKNIADISVSYDKAVKSVIEATNAEGKNDFITYVTNHLKKLSAGSSDGDILTHILSSISDDVFKEYWSIKQHEGADAAASHLFPDSKEPLVGWVATVTPVFSYLANYGYGHTNSFWFTPDGTYLQTGNLTGVPSVAFTKNEKQMVRLMLDGFCASQYNFVTKTMFNDDKVNDQIYKSGVIVSSNRASDYATYGMLRKEFPGSIFENAGSAAYLTDPTLSSLYGIATSSSSTNWTDETIHLKGGITIADQPLDEDNSIPVYYHIYPQNYPNISNTSLQSPDGIEIRQEVTDNTDKTFTPSTTYGTVVSTVAFDDLAAKKYDPDKRYLNGAATNRIDLKGTQASIAPPADGNVTVNLSSGDKKAKSVHVKVITSANIPITYYKYTLKVSEDDLPSGMNPDNLSNSDKLKIYEQLGGDSKASLAVSTSGIDSDKDYYYPARTCDHNMPSGIPVSEFSSKQAITSANYPSPSITDIERIPTGSAMRVLSNNDKLKIKSQSDISSLAVKIIDIIVTKPVKVENNDRIKTFDVTQFINQTVGAIQGSQHLNRLSSYSDEAFQYNDHFMFEPNSTHSKVNGAWLVSNPLSFSTHQKVKATNYLSSTKSTCTISTGSHSYTDPEGKTHTCSGSSSTATQYECHYAKEDVKIAYGLNVTKEQRTKDSNGSIALETWYDPSKLAGWRNFNTVGFTIPEKYYTNPDVIKMYGSQKDDRDTSYDGVYFLADVSKNINGANKYSVFDVLYRNGGEYYLRWFNDSLPIGAQSASSTSTDKYEDYLRSIGDMSFRYTSGSHPIDGVQFIAHRDLLSGDEVATSLAVSGYMAKYASKSSTASYLQFMKDCGFAFKGVSGIGGNLSWENNNINYIGHENRTIWVANASKLSDLAATNTGSTKNSYNTHYTTGNDDKYKVRMGLGGLSSDTINMYTKYIKSSNALKDNSLDDTARSGDALRAIYYYAVESKDSNTTVCNSYWSTASHSVSCHTHSKGPCTHSPAPHSSVDVKPKWTSVSNNIYVCKKDQNLTNGVYTSHAVYNKTQSDMFTDIVTSREMFKIPLAVEGTTAGAYDETGKTGISYNTDLLKLKGGVLKYKESAELDKKLQEAQKAFEKTTFEIKSAEYATVGSKTDRKNDLLAEYRYTVPTRAYTFNPSFYMQYDDDFVDVNKSVWMLSNQPREINFKNILSIRLLQPKDSEGNTKDGAAGGYPTVIDSAWSTDKEDVTIQSETKLPVLKAGNSYTTETAASSGTITAYVILQDPEFTGNPNDAQNNEQIIKEYTAEMNKILEEMGAVDVAKYTSRDNSVKDKLGFAMYTNLTNGSSTNSQFQVHNGNGELNEKEPMVITHSKLTFSRTTGTQADKQSKTANDLDNWNFYALKGNDVYAYMKTNDKNLVEGYEQQGTEISDTTANRKFLGKQVLAQSSSSGHISSTLAEINKRLTDIMANGQDKNRNIISFSDPYLNSTDGTDLRWYTEDYEGFIVAVYNIDFTLAGDNKDINNKKDSTAGIITDFSAAYRHESDWRTATNDNAADLVTPTYSNIVENTYVHNSNVDLDKTGALTLLTTGKKDEDAQEVLKNWSKALAGKKINYEPKIYGAGLELANVPIHFGSTVEGTGMIGNDNSRLSFYYQPTYFNVRGSVYDTTH